MSGIPVIGVVGTAKNTGKTTTLTYLIHHAERKGIRLGITGIGFDGEELDNITFLPKPRIHIPSGTIVTTSENCLPISTAKYDTIERTGIVTSLGEVLILKITQPGLVVIAGPNRKSTLATVIEKMRNVGVDMLFVDGSLNRLAPMAIAEKIIFTTGAARNTEINILADEMKTIERAFSFQSYGKDLPATRSIALLGKQPADNLGIMSLLDGDDVKIVLEKLNASTEHLYIPGLVSAAALQILVRHLPENAPTLILADPCTLLLAAEPQTLSSLFDLLDKKRTQLLFASRPPQLTAITINPFYPRPTGTAFAAAFVDKKELMGQMRKAIRAPLFNVKEDDNGKLFSLCGSN